MQTTDWVGFVKDNVWTFITGFFTASLLPLLQFFRSGKKDKAEAEAQVINAEQSASEMWKKELNDYKAFVKDQVTEMREEISQLRTELDNKQKEIDLLQETITALKRELKRLSKNGTPAETKP